MVYPTQLQLVTDRTQQDVDALNSKGTYNASDLNRVETAAQYLSSLLQQLPETLEAYREANKVADSSIFNLPYKVADIMLQVKTNWTASDIPRPAAMLRYIQNVKKLCSAISFNHPRLPNNMRNLTYGKANAIESSLQQLYVAALELEAEIKDLVNRAHASVYYSGDLFGGEV